MSRLRLALLQRLFQLRFLLVTSVLIAAVAAVFPVDGQGSKKGRLATHEEVAQVWVGLAADERSIVRLALNQNGTGLGGEAFLSGDLQTFRIPAWSYDRGKISPSAEALGETKFEVGALEGSVVGLRMNLTMKGRDWNRTISFRRESDLEGPWRALKNKMLNDQSSLSMEK
jgi:hypothetical protein